MAEVVSADSDDCRRKLHPGFKPAAPDACLSLPPWTQVDLPPSVHSALLAISGMLQRFQGSTQLPDLDFNDIHSVVKNRRMHAGQMVDMDDEAARQHAASDDDDDGAGENDADVQAMRNAVHLSLMRLLGTSIFDRSWFLDVDMSQPRMLDEHSWGEVLNRYIQLESEHYKQEGFAGNECLRTAAGVLATGGYGELSVQQRTDLLWFLCCEALETDECRTALQSGEERLADLRRQRILEKAEETRLAMAARQKETDDKRQADIVENQRKREALTANFATWCTERGTEKPAITEPAGAALYTEFLTEHNRKQRQQDAERLAAEQEKAAQTSDGDTGVKGEVEEDPADQQAQRSSSNESDPSEEGLSRGEVLRRMRAEREERLQQAARTKREAELAEQQRREVERAERDKKRLDLDRKRAEEDLRREKHEAHQHALDTNQARLCPLGYDRYWNRYWYFPLQADRILVEKSRLPLDARPPAVQAFDAFDEAAPDTSSDTVERGHQRRAAAVAATKAALAAFPKDAALQGRLQTLVSDIRLPSDGGRTPAEHTDALLELLLQQALPARDSYLALLVNEHQAAVTAASWNASEDAENSGGGGGDDSVAADDATKAAGAADASTESSSSLSVWWFYERPEQFDALVEFLNPFGEREAALRVALLEIRGRLVDAAAEGAASRRVSQRPRKFAASRHDPFQVCTQVLSELVGTFLGSGRSGTPEAIRRSIRSATGWQDLVAVAERLAQSLGGIADGISKEERQERVDDGDADGLAGEAQEGWEAWLATWNTNLSTIAGSPALVFALYTLRQRAMTHLPAVLGNATKRGASGGNRKPDRECRITWTQYEARRLK